jgi:S1-C subfamily serine protease
MNAGETYSLRVWRDGGYTDLVVECGDNTSRVRAGISMLRAASKGRWNECIEGANEYDRLETEQGAFSAYWRQRCSLAERCSDTRCGNVRSLDGRYYYDYQRQVIKELAAIGELDQWRSKHLSAVAWLDNNGFRRFGRELEADWRKADSPDPPKVASRLPKSASKTVFGTCFAVSPTEILTSHHVVADADLVTITFPGAAETGAVVVQHSQATDLAVLKISGESPAALALAPMRSLVIGEEVFTIGYPLTDILGVEPKFTEGSVSSLSGLKGDASYFQMSVPIQPGNSGGPVVNMRGEVVGVVASTAAIEAFYSSSGVLPQSINWASKSGYARLMFEPPIANEIAANRSEAIQMASAAICRVKAVSN